MVLFISAAMRCVDILASIRDLRRSSSSAVHRRNLRPGAGFIFPSPSARDLDQGGIQAIRTLIAFGLSSRVFPVSKVSRTPILTPSGSIPEAKRSVKCKNMSGPPASGRMNPKPRSALHHFSFPAGNLFPLFSPSSTSRRIASGRVSSGSFCLVIQVSRVASGPSSSLTPINVPDPVVTGRPRFFFSITLIDFAMINCYHKSKPGGSVTFRPALTRAIKERIPMTQADRVLSTPPTNTPTSRRRFLSTAATLAAGSAALGLAIPPASR